MGNPWAPPDPSSSPGRPPQGPDSPPAPSGEAPPPAPAPTTQPPHDAPPVGYPSHPGAPPYPAHPGQTPGHGPVGGPTPPPPPDPAGVARSSRAAAWSAAALLGSLLLVSAPYPAMLVAPLVALTSLVLAIVAAVRAVRARARGTVVALPVVLVLASFAWVGLSSQTLLYVDARRAFEECRSGALTQQAQRGCADQLEQDMEDRLASLLDRLGGRARG